MTVCPGLFSWNNFKTLNFGRSLRSPKPNRRLFSRWYSSEPRFQGWVSGANVAAPALVELVPPSLGAAAYAHTDDPVLRHSLHRRCHRAKIFWRENRYRSQESSSLRYYRLLPNCELIRSSLFLLLFEFLKKLLFQLYQPSQHNLTVCVGRCICYGDDNRICSRSRHLWYVDGIWP